MEFNHKTVLLSETIERLNLIPNGTYVDATAGGGGLSKEILSHLSENGSLVCIDRDPDAIQICREKFECFKNVTVVQENFANIDLVVHNLGIESVDGVALDLGVSSYQLDEADRGFSYNKEAPLDMRMSKVGKSAYHVVNNSDIGTLKNIILNYGEEKFASRIANSIVNYRIKKPIKTTTELSEIVVNSIPCAARRSGGHPAKRTFQAIRIYVNDELGSLERGLKAAFECLKPGGRMVVITFHSLEDRIVKNQISTWCQGCICPKDFPICVCGKKPIAKNICKKAIRPSEEEVKNNLRSRSAKLRVVEKL